MPEFHIMFFVNDDFTVSEVKAYDRRHLEPGCWWVPSKGFTVFEGRHIEATKTEALLLAFMKARESKHKATALWEAAEAAYLDRDKIDRPDTGEQA